MNERALRLFREACGLSAPISLQYDDPSQSAVDSAARSFDEPFVLVGRDPRADLFLDHAEVSRHHAFLQTIDGRVFVTELQSRTRVFWEGEESARLQGWLEHGRFIQVGPYRIRRSGRDASEYQPGMLPAPLASSDHEQVVARPLPRAALEFPIRMGGVPSIWPVEGNLVMVGRSDNCQLTFTDDSISRFHAALVPTPSGLWVIDLLTREGVHVNGISVRWAWLADGDSLRMGRFTFIVRYETCPDQLTRRDVPLEAGASLAEHPGTELAVLARQRDDGRRAVAVRPQGGSPVRLNSGGLPQAVEPATLVPSAGDVWQPSIPFPSNPMAMWQQQMQLMESFHNDMIMMVQMFVAMHKEHSASVRQELDMVQRLTRELSALQAKAAQSPESQNAGMTAGVNRPSAERKPPQAIDRKKQEKKPLAAEPAGENDRTEPSLTERSTRSRAARPKVPARNGVAPRVPNEALPVDTADFHADLTQRIAQLQRERQGYWRRILKTINK